MAIFRRGKDRILGGDQPVVPRQTEINLGDLEHRLAWEKRIRKIEQLKRLREIQWGIAEHGRKHRPRKPYLN